MNKRLNIRRNVVTTVIAFSINIALTFFGFRLVIQQGGTSALGLWSAMTAAVFVIRMGDIGMGSATERQVATIDVETDPNRARGYLDTALAINLVLFSILAIAAWLIISNHIDWIIPTGSDRHAEALAILPLMLAGFIATNVANVITSGLRGLHLAWLAAHLSVAGSFLQLIVIIALVPRLGVEGLAWAQLAQNVLIGLLAWVMFNRQLTNHIGKRPPALPTTASRELLSDLLSFSLKAQAVNFVNGLLEPASKLMVGHFGGLSILGTYEIAYKLVALPRNAVVSGVLAMTPAMTKLLRSDNAEAARMYKRAKRTVTISTGAVLALAIACSPLVSTILFGHQDKALIGYAAIMAIGFWINAIGAPAYVLGFATGILGANFISALLSLGIVLPLGWLLQQASPSTGPIGASAIALALGGAFILWQNQRLLKRPD